MRLIALLVSICLVSIACEEGRKTPLSSSSSDPSSSSDSSSMDSPPAGELNPIDLSTSVGSCTYTNLFSSQPECRSYLGAQWTIEQAENHCLGQQYPEFIANQACEIDSELGQCIFEENDQLSYVLHFPGEDPQECATVEQGCVIFAQGQFIPDDLCKDQVGNLDTSGIGSGGSVFQPFELICLPSDSEEEEQCTW